jgi:cobyric acid synthase
MGEVLETYLHEVFVNFQTRNSKLTANKETFDLTESTSSRKENQEEADDTFSKTIHYSLLGKFDQQTGQFLFLFVFCATARGKEKCY